jgi:hypothetical protein
MGFGKPHVASEKGTGTATSRRRLVCSLEPDQPSSSFRRRTAADGDARVTRQRAHASSTCARACVSLSTSSLSREK